VFREAPVFRETHVFLAKAWPPHRRSGYTGPTSEALVGSMHDPGEPRGTSGVVPHLFRAAVLISFAVLAAQLWRLQIVEGPQLRQRADNNRVRVSQITPPRGVIYDRNGAILASNAPSFVVSVVPADLPPRGEAAVYGRLAGLLDINPAEIQQAVDKRRAAADPFTPVPLKSNVPREAALMIEQRHIELPGVVVSVETARKYVDGPLFAHIIGYTGPISPQVLSPDEYKQKIDREGYTVNDRIGTAGVEDTYESYLRGRPGKRMYEVEASGRVVAELRVERPEPGRNFPLTLYIELQRTVANTLREGLHNGNVGVAIVSNVKSGEILSMVSLPSFDDNIFGDDAREEELSRLLKDAEQPFFHRAIAGRYPPGSTFKVVTGLGALQEGIATRDTTIETHGVLYVPNDFYPTVRQRFPDWPGAPQGRFNLTQAIANSSNIYFFYLGGGYDPERFVGLGNERLARAARTLGFGAPTGIDLPGESVGTVPDEAWKVQKIGEKWVKGDTYNMSIGQGYVEATPIQIHNMTAAIANGGTLLKPRVVKEISDTDGNVVLTIQPEAIRTVEIDKRHLRTVVEGMEAGFSGPLLRDYRIPGLRVAAKTGTAEYGQAVDPQSDLPTHGWFTGFAPVENPEIAVTVFVERGSSSKDAAPIAARILRQYFGVSEDFQAPPQPQSTVAPARSTVPAPSNLAPSQPTVPRQSAPTNQPAVAPPTAPSRQEAPAPTAAPARSTQGPLVPAQPPGNPAIVPKPPSLFATPAPAPQQRLPAAPQAAPTRAAPPPATKPGAAPKPGG
jgi:penicillin-binding protein 2